MRRYVFQPPFNGARRTFQNHAYKTRRGIPLAQANIAGAKILLNKTCRGQVRRRFGSGNSLATRNRGCGRIPLTLLARRSVCMRRRQSRAAAAAATTCTESGGR